MSHNSPRRLGLLGFLTLATPMCGGSSTSPADTTGPEPGCVPGRRVECPCDDGTTSSQVCSDSGMTYLACECDGPGPSAGAPSVGGGGTGIVAAGTGGLDDSGGAPSPAGAGSSDGGESAQAGAPSLDDPCPDAVEIVNCSSTCDNQETCVVSRCYTPLEHQRINVTNVPAVVRTPASPGDQYCEACELDVPAAVANITIEGPVGAPYRYEVDPPWVILPSGAPGHDLCGGAQCLIWSQAVLIATTDPDAPARNVKISLGGFCP